MIGSFVTILFSLSLALNSDEVNMRTRHCAKLLGALQAWAEIKAQEELTPSYILSGEAQIKNEEKNAPLFTQIAFAFFSRSALLEFLSIHESNESKDPLTFFKDIVEKENLSGKEAALDNVFEILLRNVGISRTDGNKLISWNAAYPDQKTTVTAPEGWTVRSFGTTQLEDDKSLYSIQFNSLVGELISANSSPQKTAEIIDVFSNAYARSPKENLAYIHFFTRSIIEWFYSTEGYETWRMPQKIVVNRDEIAHRAVIVLDRNKDRAIDDLERLFFESDKAESNVWNLSGEYLFTLVQLWLHFEPYNKTRLIELLSEVWKRYPSYRDHILSIFLDLHLAWMDEPQAWADRRHPLSSVSEVLKYENPVKYNEGSSIQMDLVAALLYEVAVVSNQPGSEALSVEQIFLEGAKKVRAEPDFNYGPEVTVEETMRHFMPSNRSFREMAKSVADKVGRYLP
jgi:hypothetical protein